MQWLAAFAIIYFLVCAVGLIGDGFKKIGSETASNLFAFASNPLVGLFLGPLATSSIQ